MAIHLKKIVQKKTLIYGGGAIGSYLASCLVKSNHKIFFLCRKDNYKIIKSKGLTLRIYNNSVFKKKIKLLQSKNFRVINNLKGLKNFKFDNIFITTKINQNLKKIFKNIELHINNKTLIITPCTAIPFWWYKCLNSNLQEKFEKNLYYLYLKNIKRKNLVGMTMWLSGRIKTPGEVIISHVQRGFPIKEVFDEKKMQVDRLRQDLKKSTLSPKINNIFFEIFSKSLNSLAFNMVALKYQQNNKGLSKNTNSINDVLNIMKEGDKILKTNNIKIFQSPTSRIKQTLKSKNHTMSMLYAYQNNKEIELDHLWKSFVTLTEVIRYNMKFTKKIYNFVSKKINGSF
jgi:ketopantoate reductase